jgi:tetratricopeptide (TPR) repeat protein
MAFEKAKVLKAAEKFLSQGKINAAIKEYRQIIENDDDDLTALNMLGDLLTRAGQKEEAVSCFTRIAEHYREQEFRLKAIAMYKKIEKLKPRDPETAKRLAELYAAQGLIVDARAQYLIIADAYTRAGETRQTLKVLHKIADLDPQNADARFKLAEGYLKEGLKAEALKAYTEAANRMLEKGEFDKSLAAYSKAFELRPHDREILNGLLSTHVALGTPRIAAELIEKAVADEPGDGELLVMLAQAYIEAEDAPGAEAAISALNSQDASNYRHYIEVARAYLKSGDNNEAARVLGHVIEPMLAGREENDLLELVNELLARDPEHIAGLRFLARIHWWQRDMEKLRAALERLAESAAASAQSEDERYALTQLVRLAPDEQKFVDRLDALGGVLEEGFEETQVDEEPAIADVPSFESFAVNEAYEGVVEPEAPTAEFVFNSGEQGIHDANSSFADLNEADVHLAAGDDLLIAEPMSGDSSAPDVSDSQSFDVIPVEPIGAEPPKVEAMMQQELESVDFYIDQGYSDIAVDTLELLERQFGSHPDIALRRQKLNQAGMSSPQGTDQGVSAPAQESFVIDSGSQIEMDPGEVSFAEVTESPVQMEPLVPSSTPTGIDSGLAEIFEDFRMEAEGDHASSNEDYETHYNMATAYKEMDLLDEAIREFQTAANLTKPADGTSRFFQCCNMLGHCFVEKGMPSAAVLWFKKGLEAPGRSPEEYKAIQYELGSAFEQMSDLPRAISAFTEVYGVDVGYRDIATRLQELQTRQASQKKKKRK